MKDLIEKIQQYFYTASDGEIYDIIISRVEKELIERALERSYGNQVMASKILGLNRNTLRAKIRKLDIDPRRFKR